MRISLSARFLPLLAITLAAFPLVTRAEQVIDASLLNQLQLGTEREVLDSAELQDLDPIIEEFIALYRIPATPSGATASRGFTHAFWFRRDAEEFSSELDFVTSRTQFYAPGNIPRISFFFATDGSGELMIRDEVGAMGGVQGIPPMPEIEISTGATVDDTEWHHFAICMEYVSGPWGKFDGVQYHVEEYYLTDVTIKLDNVTIASFTDVPTNPIMSLNPDFDPPENVDTPTIITEFGEWGRDPGAIGASDVVEAVTLAPINDTF